MASIGSTIANSLGAGSGVDSAQIVKDLTAAVRGPKEAVIKNRTSLNDARISGIASAKSSLTTFSKALDDLLSGTGFSGEPGSNDPSIASVSLLPGGVPTGLPAQIEVQQLASAQTVESAMLAGKTTPVGLGTLTLNAGGTDYTIDITSANNTLEGLAAAVNATDSSVTASVVTDNRGSRLVLKGITGATNGFSITAGTADADLQRFTTSGATGALVQKTNPLDSIIQIDGVEIRNNTNTVETAIPYVRIDLNKAVPGTKVTLASTEPTSSIRELVVEFVAAYNTLRSALNSASAAGTDSTQAGALAGDSSIRDTIRELSRLTSTSLASSGEFRTLGDIGIGTNRDGTLKIDTDRLDAVLAANPTAITQMLNPSLASETNPGLAGAVKNVSDKLLADNGVLKSATARYTTLQKSLTEQLAKLNSDMEDYEARTAAIFSSMDSKLASLKATQSYLDQQIKVWNGNN